MGIEAVNNRIADIQSRIIALQTQQATRPTAASGSTATTSASGASFASALADAVGAQSTTAPAAAAKSYTLNGKGIPTELAAYGNGKIPATALEQVGGTRHRLWAPAAESLTRMIADAKAQGVKIGITDSYRPYAEQVDLARRKGLYSQGGLAAKPGTSEHGWGMATDLDLNTKAQAWMRANAEKYGFVENVPREPWHWAYKPKSV
ncbi:M15 family metallopeptidase [Pseudosporangium ferrugineum]|uniref:LAS superfamily LD-carboxypeptidase LdcB n=1 Tax=Pseudosporangium ferrugineum TaxID=439699 RepID=A0A2T0S9Y7_9ACTN|nr:M15 family metallopeptidase [Pseudosporangium ferrugineum]PRY30239.1 LAS superfamily LD-carboxypeptidase LdcB [Pseudosporangium ferrugineum]